MNENVIKVVLILMCCIVSLQQQLETDDYMKREHSLIKPYMGSGMAIYGWDFMGSTMVSNNFIRLTPDLQSKSGSLWNYVPCTSINWEVHLQFKVHGKGKELFGDGLAFWYVRERMIAGPVFGSKDLFSGLAIFLDTYSNFNGPHDHDHPYISAMINNGTISYDHDRDGTHTALSEGCEAKFRNRDHNTYISIKYQNDVLTVSTDIDEKQTWETCFTVSNVKLPTGYYFGISATTGDLTDNHDIMAIRTYELEPPLVVTEDRSKIIPSAMLFESHKDHKDVPQKGNWSNIKTFFKILFFMILCIVIIVLCIMWFQNRKAKTKKRFY